jgi:hypothetical protein
MNIKSTLFAGSLIVLLTAGCAGTPSDPARAADKTPRWLKDYVTGSRIPRTVDKNGNTEGTSGTLSTTSPSRLGYLPGVTIRSR